MAVHLGQGLVQLAEPVQYLRQAGVGAGGTPVLPQMAATGTPASIILRIGAMPEARRMFEHGQCAMPVPVRPNM